MKKHFRNVKRLTGRFKGELSITIPCGGAYALLTRDTTKDEQQVTCKRCLDWLAKNPQPRHKP